MSLFRHHRWPLRILTLALVLALAPSAPCAIGHVTPRTDWARTISWVAGSDHRAAREALHLIQAGDSGLALVRLDASDQRARGPLAVARLVSAWLLAETVHTLGALPPANSRQA